MASRCSRFYLYTKSRWKEHSCGYKSMPPSRHFQNISHNTVSASVIKTKLKQSDVPFSDGYTCYHVNECTLCYPLVKRTSSTRSTDIYINQTTGFFVCDNCKCTGNWDVLHRLLTEWKKNTERTGKEVAALKDGCVRYDKSGDKWKELTGKSQILHQLPQPEVTTVLNDFHLTPCLSTVIEKLNILISEDRSTLYFPLQIQTQQIVGYVSVDKHGVSVTVPRSECCGFISISHKKKQSPVVLVSNVQDLLCLAAQNVCAHILCLPYGVANLPQSSLPYLEPYSKIVLWLGSKVGAWDSAKNFAKKLNEKRCFVIRPTGNQYSPTAAVATGESVHKIIAEAQPTWHQAITTFSSLRNDVFTELQNNEEVLGIKWKRYPALNKILKGHRRGELTVLTGPTGSGKTTFMSDYSLDLAMQGVNTLWGSFEIRNVRLVRTMLQQFSGCPLEENLNNFDMWADKFEKLPIYYMTFHGQQSIRAVMEAVEHSSYIYDIAHVIIDNVQFMIGVADDSKFVDRFWKQDVIIQAFRTFATTNNCHVTLVIHPRKERDTEDLTTSSIFGGAKAAQEADNILIIQDKRLTAVRGKKYLQVSKNRYTGDLGVMVLEYDKSSLSYMHRKKTTSETEPKQEVAPLEV